MRGKLKELFLYGIGGVLTTVVNYLGLELWNMNYLLANTLAWAAAVIFSYCVNRKLVFESKRGWAGEFVSFAGLRLVTLAVENLLLFLLIGQLHVSSPASKIAVSILTVLGNYIICKKHIFQAGKAKREAVS